MCALPIAVNEYFSSSHILRLIEPGEAWHSLLELKNIFWTPVESNTVRPGAPKSGLILPGPRTNKEREVLCYTRMDQAGQGLIRYSML